jgi:sugar/nucleoside kinase (ribokinase family)
MNPPRSGILAAGNFIVDHVKIIDAYPPQDTLATILSESKSNGGGPYNVLRDLAAMGAAYPLAACGLVGDDDHGRWIRADLEAQGIDATQLHARPGLATSYTDAMTEQGSGRRTFFHRRGANACFDVSHCDFSISTARHFHLGYLMLLDRLDEIGPDGHSGASYLLEAALAAGLRTSVDMVSARHPRFREIATSALPWTDFLIVNEYEAGATLGLQLDPRDAPGLESAAGFLLDAGVREAAVIHTRHGAVAVSRDGTCVRRAALKLPEDLVRGATGAGDAFAAGILHGLHEGFPLHDCLHLATCTAAISLTDPTPSRGLRPVSECLALATLDPDPEWTA